jgi:hypothetical protein
MKKQLGQYWSRCAGRKLCQVSVGLLDWLLAGWYWLFPLTAGQNYAAGVYFVVTTIFFQKQIRLLLKRHMALCWVSFAVLALIAFFLPGSARNAGNPALFAWLGLTHCLIAFLPCEGETKEAIP